MHVELTCLGLADVATFFPPPLAPAAPAAANGSSSLGTMSMRKSNWSDLLKALAMSERESVRRLLASATMKARAVISDINTRERRFSNPEKLSVHQTYFRMLYKRESELHAGRFQSVNVRLIEYIPSAAIIFEDIVLGYCSRDPSEASL